jgi:integrase
MRAIHKLKVKQIEAINTPGRYADGGGLYLIVDGNVSKRWAMIYMVENRRREMGLGGLSKVTLAQAREKAAELRRMIGDGIDPLANQDKQKAPAPPFSDIAERYMADHAHSWKSAVHRRQWRQTLEQHAASIWRKPVDRITVADVLAVLRPLWNDKAETASRLRGRIERVLDAARVAGHVPGENVARWKGNLQAMLPPPRKLVRGHHAAMPYQDAPAFIAAIRAREAIAARMLELIILTATRSNEVRSMTWEEIDWTNRVWNIPAARMKAGRPHRVPLVGRAYEILASRYDQGSSGLIWPSDRRKPYTDPVFSALYGRMKLTGITTHGFRSSFKDWAEDCTAHQNVVIEAALAHAVGDKSERAYRRTDAIEKRRALLHDWAVFLGCA